MLIQADSHNKQPDVPPAPGQRGALLMLACRHPRVAIETKPVASARRSLRMRGRPPA